MTKGSPPEEQNEESPRLLAIVIPEMKAAPKDGRGIMQITVSVEDQSADGGRTALKHVCSQVDQIGDRDATLAIYVGG